MSATYSIAARLSRTGAGSKDSREASIEREKVRSIGKETGNAGGDVGRGGGDGDGGSSGRESRVGTGGKVGGGNEEAEANR